MFHKYLTIAWRNIKKYKFYSIVNLSGLTLGLAAFLFLLLFVRDELSYDQDLPFAERTFRVDTDGQLGDQNLSTAQSGAPLGPTAETDFPEVAAYCRLYRPGTYLLTYGKRRFNEPAGIYADSTFFRVFGGELLAGQAEDALRQPYNIVISQSLSQKYFGLEDPMGKLIKVGDDQAYTVTGIMADRPGNSHFKCNYLLSLSSNEDSRSPYWGNMNFSTYLVLYEGTEVAAFSEKLNDHLVSQYFAPEVEQYIGMPWADFIAAGNAFSYSLLPATRIHLHSDRDGELAANGDIKYVWIFGAIALFILLIACINFMNLTTARAAVRAREIGVRKVVGARPRQLVGQFLGESALFTGLAVVLALGLQLLLLGQFNDWTGKTFSWTDILNPGFLLIILAVGLTTSLLAGAYPAFFLSRLPSLHILKGGQLSSQGRPSRFQLRNLLVVFQFTVTILLLSGTLVVQRQLDYIQSKKLGYERDQILLVERAYALGDRVSAFKQQLLARPEVTSATVTGFLPVPSYRSNSTFFKGRNADLEQAVRTNYWDVDSDYIRTLGMQIVQGRDFSPSIASDSQAVIINQQLAAHYEGDPVGQEISSMAEMGQELSIYKIIGVVEDFNYESLRQQIEPLVLRLGSSAGYLCLKVNAEGLATLLPEVESLWQSLDAEYPFSYSFMDEEFQSVYEAEQATGRIVSAFTFLAIFIACIGLIGLSTFLIQQRRKEIGIRKVLGASSWRIVGLLTQDFVGLVLVALVIALPLAWWGMDQWLQNFAYRMPLRPGLLLLAGLSAVGIAILTVGWQSLRAARGLPVDSLRRE